MGRVRRAWVVAIVACSGCAPFTVSNGVGMHRETRVSATLPANWIVESVDPRLVVTRNGAVLQRITISATPVDAELSGTERRYRADMLPNEVAELTLGLIEASPGHAQFEVIGLDFDELAGQAAYRADLSFVDGAGLPRRSRVHEAIIADHVLRFAYEAARAVYYDVDESAFEALLASVELNQR